MPDFPLSAIASGVVGGLLAPLIVHWLGRAAPPAETSEFDSLGIETLRARNNQIDVVGQVLSFCGLLTAFPFYFGPLNSESPWPLGMGFGMMAIFPVTYFWIATRGGGLRRWHEFWRYYELKWGVGLRAVRWVFGPLATLGVISLIMVLSGI